MSNTPSPASFTFSLDSDDDDSKARVGIAPAGADSNSIISPPPTSMEMPPPPPISSNPFLRISPSSSPPTSFISPASSASSGKSAYLSRYLANCQGTVKTVEQLGASPLSQQRLWSAKTTRRHGEAREKDSSNPQPYQLGVASSPSLHAKSVRNTEDVHSCHSHSHNFENSDDLGESSNASQASDTAKAEADEETLETESMTQDTASVTTNSASCGGTAVNVDEAEVMKVDKVKREGYMHGAMDGNGAAGEIEARRAERMSRREEREEFRNSRATMNEPQEGRSDQVVVPSADSQPDEAISHHSASTDEEYEEDDNCKEVNNFNYQHNRILHNQGSHDEDDEYIDDGIDDSMDGEIRLVLDDYNDGSGDDDSSLGLGLEEKDLLCRPSSVSGSGSDSISNLGSGLGQGSSSLSPQSKPYPSDADPTTPHTEIDDCPPSRPHSRADSRSSWSVANDSAHNANGSLGSRFADMGAPVHLDIAEDHSSKDNDGSGVDDEATDKVADFVGVECIGQAQSPQRMHYNGPNRGSFDDEHQGQTPQRHSRVRSFDNDDMISFADSETSGWITEDGDGMTMATSVNSFSQCGGRGKYSVSGVTSGYGGGAGGYGGTSSVGGDSSRRSNWSMDELVKSHSRSRDEALDQLSKNKWLQLGGSGDGSVGNGASSFASSNGGGATSLKEPSPLSGPSGSSSSDEGEDRDYQEEERSVSLIDHVHALLERGGTPSENLADMSIDDKSEALSVALSRATRGSVRSRRSRKGGKRKSKGGGGNETEQNKDELSRMCDTMVSDVLSAMFGPPWTSRTLAKVLRLHDGEMRPTIKAVLTHGDGEPEELVRKLRDEKREEEARREKTREKEKKEQENVDAGEGLHAMSKEEDDEEDDEEEVTGGVQQRRLKKFLPTIRPQAPSLGEEQRTTSTRKEGSGGVSGGKGSRRPPLAAIKRAFRPPRPPPTATTNVNAQTRPPSQMLPPLHQPPLTGGAAIAAAPAEPLTLPSTAVDLDESVASSITSELQHFLHARKAAKRSGDEGDKIGSKPAAVAIESTTAVDLDDTVASSTTSDLQHFLQARKAAKRSCEEGTKPRGKEAAAAGERARKVVVVVDGVDDDSHDGGATSTKKKTEEDGEQEIKKDELGDSEEEELSPRALSVLSSSPADTAEHALRVIDPTDDMWQNESERSSPVTICDTDGEAKVESDDDKDDEKNTDGKARRENNGSKAEVRFLTKNIHAVDGAAKEEGDNDDEELHIYAVDRADEEGDANNDDKELNKKEVSMADRECELRKKKKGEEEAAVALAAQFTEEEEEEAAIDDEGGSKIEAIRAARRRIESDILRLVRHPGNSEEGSPANGEDSHARDSCKTRESEAAVEAEANNPSNSSPEKLEELRARQREVESFIMRKLSRDAEEQEDDVGSTSLQEMAEDGITKEAAAEEMPGRGTLIEDVSPPHEDGGQQPARKFESPKMNSLSEERKEGKEGTDGGIRMSPKTFLPLPLSSADQARRRRDRWSAGIFDSWTTMDNDSWQDFFPPEEGTEISAGNNQLLRCKGGKSNRASSSANHAAIITAEKISRATPEVVLTTYPPYYPSQPQEEKKWKSKLKSCSLFRMGMSARDRKAQEEEEDRAEKERPLPFTKHKPLSNLSKKAMMLGDASSSYASVQKSVGWSVDVDEEEPVEERCALLCRSRSWNSSWEGGEGGWSWNNELVLDDGDTDILSEFGERWAATAGLGERGAVDPDADGLPRTGMETSNDHPFTAINSNTNNAAAILKTPPQHHPRRSPRSLAAKARSIVKGKGKSSGGKDKAGSFSFALAGGGGARPPPCGSTAFPLGMPSEGTAHDAGDGDLSSSFEPMSSFGSIMNEHPGEHDHPQPWQLCFDQQRQVQEEPQSNQQETSSAMEAKERHPPMESSLEVEYHHAELKECVTHMGTEDEAAEI